MQKAIFLEEAYNKGLLTTITEGFIFTLNTPEMDNPERSNDPFLIQMIAYSGLKSVEDLGNGVKFQAQGQNMFCMLEPSNYPQKHVEPTSRSQNSTEFMPYRFSECDIFPTKDMKYRVLMAKESHTLFDSFVVEFPSKGDLCVLYYIFDKKNIDTVVMPFIQENISYILRKQLRFRDIDSKNISKKFIEIVKKFNINT
jgi:hypothetical protein